jgi:hypothetical protein
MPSYILAKDLILQVPPFSLLPLNLFSCLFCGFRCSAHKHAELPCRRFVWRSPALRGIWVQRLRRNPSIRQSACSAASGLYVPCADCLAVPCTL